MAHVSNVPVEVDMFSFIETLRFCHVFPKGLAAVVSPTPGLSENLRCIRVMIHRELL